MSLSVVELQEQIFNEINDPKNQIYLKVQKKMIIREEYLADIRKRCEKENLEPEETEDVVYLVDKALWGFGLVDDLINDDDVSDIRLINENTIRVKRNGKREATNLKFASKEEYLHYIEFITNRNNTNISITNAAQVFTDKDTCESAILRFSLVSDLVNTGDRPTLLIRKILKHKIDFNRLIREGYATEEQVEYLKHRWKSGHGILVCGPNGSGKTTLINALLDSTPHNKSAVVMQESEELFCDTHPEMIFRKVVPHRAGSNIAYLLKDLSRLALMESFDIIVVGEIKGDEAADLSYATYTGSQCMTSVHSNSAAEGYDKMIDYALDAQPNRTRTHFAKQLAALDTVVFVKDYHIEQILEENGYNKNTEEYDFKEVNFGNNETEHRASSEEQRIESNLQHAVNKARENENDNTSYASSRITPNAETIDKNLQDEDFERPASFDHIDTSEDDFE